MHRRSLNRERREHPCWAWAALANLQDGMQSYWVEGLEHHDEGSLPSSGRGISQ